MKSRIIAVKPKPKILDKKATLMAEKLEILKMMDRNKKKFSQIKSKVDTRWRAGTPSKNKSWRCQKKLMSTKKRIIQGVWRKPNES